MSDREWQRLTTLYAEQTDDELLALHARSADLTDLAQDALAHVVQQRGLEIAAPVAAQGNGAGTVSTDAAEKDEVEVYLFSDAFQASQAVQHLRAARLPHRLIDQLRESNSVVSLLLVTPREHAGSVGTVLNDTMGLFPAVSIGGHDYASPGDLYSVMMFSSAADAAAGEDLNAALAAAATLARAGISFLWRDGRTSPEGLPDATAISLEVGPADADRAMVLIEHTDVEL